MGDQGGNGVGRRRGVAQIAAEGSPVLDLSASNQQGGVVQAGIELCNPGVFVKADTGNTGTQGQSRLGIERQLHELGNLLAVHDEIHIAPVLPHLDDQIGASAQDAGPLPLLLQQAHRFR